MNKIAFDLRKYFVGSNSADYSNHVLEFIDYVIENYKDFMIREQNFIVQFKAFLDYLIAKGIIKTRLSQDKIKEVFDLFEQNGIKVEKIGRAYCLDFKGVIYNEN